MMKPMALCMNTNGTTNSHGGPTSATTTTPHAAPSSTGSARDTIRTGSTPVPARLAETTPAVTSPSALKANPDAVHESGGADHALVDVGRRGHVGHHGPEREHRGARVAKERSMAQQLQPSGGSGGSVAAVRGAASPEPRPVPPRVAPTSPASRHSGSPATARAPQGRRRPLGEVVDDRSGDHGTAEAARACTNRAPIRTSIDGAATQTTAAATRMPEPTIDGRRRSNLRRSLPQHLPDAETEQERRHRELYGGRACAQRVLDRRKRGEVQVHRQRA